MYIDVLDRGTSLLLLLLLLLLLCFANVCVVVISSWRQLLMSLLSGRYNRGERGDVQV